jgi:hypothetical protein
MSTYTDRYAPALVSEVPAVAGLTTSRPGLWARLLEELASRRDSRTFERAISRAEHSEAHDLLALSRRG